MNKDLQQQLIQDPEIVTLLKTLITEKTERYEHLLKAQQAVPDSLINEILNQTLNEEDINLILQRLEVDEEVKRLEIDLSNMCYALNTQTKHFDTNDDWMKAYDHATHNIPIERVVGLLTREQNFKRNIKCPFHDDRTASLKVYVKNNRFICFGCNARGSPLDFVMQYKNCPFKEAVLFLSTM